jgi:catechol 2,3-dioxygenase-like lactoylglutathione lyase family enzyme
VSALRKLVEVVLVVQDIERSLDFYGRVLGLELISPTALPVKFLRIGPPGPDVPQQVVLVPAGLAGGGAPGAERKRVLHHIGLSVAPEDYAAERARLAAEGLSIRSGEHPFLPVEAFYLDDPDGNEVEIVTWRGQNA